MKRKILLVEDQPDIVRGLTDALEFEGFEVLAAREGAEGIRLARERSPDCIILDLMLPDANGYAVCTKIRSLDNLVPIIMLTARSQESDKIRGLEVGADDYVTKPFSVGELLARIKALFRRMHRNEPALAVVKIGGAEIDFKKHQLQKGSELVPLTFYEVELLKLLYERTEQPVSRDEILDKIWGVEANPTNRTVDNFIVKLRRKIEDDHKQPVHILTVYGYGYKLVP